MATLCLQEEEMLAEKVQDIPVLYDERVKVLQKRMLFKCLGESGRKFRFCRKW